MDKTLTLHEQNALEHGYAPHNFHYPRNGFGHAVRTCRECGYREAYWDDEEYPIDPCPAACTCELGGKGDLEDHWQECGIYDYVQR